MAQFSISNVFLAAIVLIFASVQKTTAQTQVAIELPQDVSVIQGGTAEFICVLNVLNEAEYMNWLIYYMRTYQTGIGGMHQGYHSVISRWVMVGNIYAFHETNGNTKKYTLRITNVTQTDAPVCFQCYVSSVGVLGDRACLTVWKSPHCSFRFESSNGSIVSATNGLDVTLACSVPDGDPTTTLQWQSSRGQVLSNNMTHMNTMNIIIFPKDNGQDYVCVAYSPTLLHPLTCSITPYEVPYLASISPPWLEISHNGTFNLICFDFGNSTSDTYFQWLWGNTPVDFLETDTGVHINHSDDGKSSTMKIDGGLAAANNEQNQLQVTCEILVSQTSVSNASAMVIFVEDDEGTGERTNTRTPDEYSTSNPLEKTNTNSPDENISRTIIIAAICTSLAFLMMGLAGGIVIGKKWNATKPSTKKSDSKNKDTTDQVEMSSSLAPYYSSHIHSYQNVETVQEDEQDYDVINTNPTESDVKKDAHPYQALQKDHVRKEQSDPSVYMDLKPTGSLSDAVHVPAYQNV